MGILTAGDGRCDEVQYQTWIDYNPQWKAGEHLVFFGDGGLRRHYADPRAWRLVLRPSIGYDMGAWQLAGGLGNFYTDFAGVLYIYELRPWQGLQLQWPSFPIKLSHLFRLEERFFFDTESGNSIFRFRFRYQIGTRINWTESAAGRGWNSPVSIEAFFMFDDKAEDRFGEEARVTVGLAHVFSPEFRIELDLLWQKTARLLDLYSDNELYLRLRFYQNF